MKIFIAGATGVIGRSLIPLLVARGDTVTGLTRSEGKRGMLEQLGAHPVVVDAFDAAAVRNAIAAAQPEVVLHQMTALTGLGASRNVARMFAGTSRLRTQGTDILLEASRAAGVPRFIAQSYCGYLPAADGPRVVTEEEALDPDRIAALAPVLEPLAYLERVVTTASWTTGIVLRYGGLYGPGTTMSLRPPGAHSELVRKRWFPIIGSGAGIWSFLHVEDAASATVAAIDRAERGIYQICDNEPAPVREWLPELAAALGAKPPFRVPRWIGRLAAGEAAVAVMTQVSGASNEKARRELGWTPYFPSWREGIRHGLE